MILIFYNIEGKQSEVFFFIPLIFILNSSSIYSRFKSVQIKFINKVMSETAETVIITGGTGYIGQHIVAELLKDGYKVVAIVRSAQASLNLIKLFNHPYLSTQVVEQLDKPKSIDFVLKQHKEATAFIASAAVVKFDAQDQEEEVLKPSLAIIENTLKSIHHYGEQIKRVVLTSSTAAIVGPDKAFSATAEYSEDDWSPLTYEAGKANGTMAYFTSKKLNEEYAWKYIKEEKPHFDLVSVNPALILGPVTFESEVSLEKFPSTTGMIGGLLHLQKDSYVTELQSGAIDVRDVAKVHVSVIKNPKASNQRLLLEAYKTTNPNMINIIKNNFPEYKDKLPDVAPDSESDFKLPSDTKTKEILGIKHYEYTLEQSVVDLVKQILK